MRNKNALARKFINENIKINTAISSYPLCKVTRTGPISTETTSTSNQKIKTTKTLSSVSENIFLR